MPRKAFKAGLRFDVFIRDGFKCRYCGGTPDKVLLHVDHVIPVAKGGGNEIENLVTACKDCNLGKGKKLVTSKIAERDIKAETEEMKEKEAILKEYYKYLNAKGRLSENMRGYKAVEQLLGCTITEKGKLDVDKRVKKFGVEIVAEVIRDYDDAADSYKVGIMYNKQRESENPEAYKTFLKIVWGITGILKAEGHQFPLSVATKDSIRHDCKFFAKDQPGRAADDIINEFQIMMDRLLELASNHSLSKYAAIKAFLLITDNMRGPYFHFEAPNYVLLEHALLHGEQPYSEMEQGFGLYVSGTALNLAGFEKPSRFEDPFITRVFEKDGKHYLTFCD